MKHLIEFFLANPIRQKSGHIYRKSLLILISCLVIAGIDIFFIIVSMLADFKQGVYAMSLSFIIYLLIALLFRTRLPNDILGNLYSANFFMVIFSMSLFSGGVHQHSVILPWLTVVPAIALLLANRFSAWAWFFICIGALTLLALMSKESTPILYNTKYDALITVLTFGGLIITALIINAVFETNQVNAFRALEIAHSNITSQNKEISEQADALRKLNKSLSHLNGNLEKAVEERTAELNSKNQKLAQYAFMNAHKLRAPLARILGLVQLYKYPQILEQETDYIVDRLSHSAKELDDVVTDINNKLENEELYRNIDPIMYKEVM